MNSILKSLITAILLLFTINIYAQDCRQFHNGIFRLAGPEGKDFILIRKGDTQIERKVGDSLKYEFKINWLDDCAYTLTPTRETITKFNMPTDLVLNVQIVSTKGNSYKFTCSSNLSTLERSGEIIQLKK